jgi:hypothetical protein
MKIIGSHWGRCAEIMALSLSLARRREVSARRNRLTPQRNRRTDHGVVSAVSGHRETFSRCRGDQALIGRQKGKVLRFLPAKN